MKSFRELLLSGSLFFQRELQNIHSIRKKVKFGIYFFSGTNYFHIFTAPKPKNVKPFGLKIYSLFILTSLLFSCGSGNTEKVDVQVVDDTLNVQTLQDALDKEAKENKRANDSLELKESIKKIEEKYGEQWDFCSCVVKGDSINKAFAKPNLPDKEFERLSKRFDEIDEKCQAFRIQDANRTPEERAAHEKKVKKCLKAAGIKN